MDEERATRRGVEWADVALAALTLLLSASLLVSLGRREPQVGPAAWAAVLVHCLPVAVRRRAPRSAFALSTAGGGVYLAMGWPMVGLGLTALIMTYSLAAYVPRRESLAGLALIEVGLVAALAVGGISLQPDTMVGNALMLAAAWALGDSARRRRGAALVDQRRLAQQAVSEERLRLARELHDIVAHSMSVVTVQAGTARMVLDDDPAHAKKALASIEQVSRQAMDELRRLLDVLRDEGEGPSLAPMPQLDDLDQLVAGAAEGGMPLEVRVEGSRRPLPPGVELATFRVVQEALTNVRKHAPGAPARLSIAFQEEEVVVEVENDLAPGEPSGRPGHGLAGMRERVSLYGGDLQAGPTAQETFRLVARIPHQVQPG